MDLSDPIFLMAVAILFSGAFRKEISEMVEAICNHKRLFAVVLLKEAHLDNLP